MQDVWMVAVSTFYSAYLIFIGYLPRFFAGLAILVIGLVLSRVAKSLVLTLFKTLRVGKFLVQLRAIREEEAFKVWETLLSVLTLSSLTILFLVAALDAWGL